ncbi:MAG TPA: hypothetical protein VHF26_26855 [Trebonia sp.]|nr:hypothetical protein [Trebonia sp.]
MLTSVPPRVVYVPVRVISSVSRATARSLLLMAAHYPGWPR